MTHPDDTEADSSRKLERILMQDEHWDSMKADVLKCLPNEACGILSGIGDKVLLVIPVRNELQSPFRFRMDPSEQLAAMLRIEGMGLEMVGIYHSHVHGPAEPSATDLEEAYYPNVAYLIWFPAEKDWSCRSFHLIGSSASEIQLLVDFE